MRTPSFVTWRSRLATAPDTPTFIVIYGGQFTGGVHPPNQFVPEIVSPLHCSPALVRHTLLIVYFSKELISFIGSLDKCHTSALIPKRVGLVKGQEISSLFSKLFLKTDVHLQKKKTVGMSEGWE